MDIQCACGKSIPAPEKSASRYLTCPQCNAVHTLAAGPDGSRKWLIVVPCALIIAACLAYLGYKLLQKEPEPLPPDAKGLYELARKEFERGNIGGAIDNLEKVRQLDPTIYEAQVVLGKCYRLIGHYRQSIDPLTAAVEGKPGDLESQLLLADSYVNTGYCDKAIEMLGGIVAARPEEPRPRFMLADAYLWQDKLDQAEKHFRIVAEKSGFTDPNVVSRLHRVLVYEGKLEEAAKVSAQARRSLVGGASSPEIAMMEAAMFREKRQLEEAEKRIDEVLPDTKAGSDLWLLLMRWKVYLALERGTYDRALAATDLVLARPIVITQATNMIDMAVFRVESLLLLGRNDEAKKTAAALAGQIDPNADFLREARAACRLVEGAGTREEVIASLSGAPKRAMGRWYLFVALHARAQGNQEAFKADLKLAADKTIGNNFPRYLLETLQK